MKTCCLWARVLIVVRKCPPMQLLDSLAAVLENQVCSAVGEDLHVCVHTQHQRHLESPCPLPVSMGTSKPKLPFTNGVRTKGAGSSQTTAICLPLHGCALKRKCLLLLIKTVTRTESLQPPDF